MSSSRLLLAVAVVAIVAAGLVIVPALGTFHVAEAKSKTGKIKVVFGQTLGYFGKAKIKITNIDKEKVLVKADLNFKKLHASEGSKCCYKVYEYKVKGNQDGDMLFLKVTAEGGSSWSQYDPLTLGKTTKINMYLDEIGCNEECE